MLNIKNNQKGLSLIEVMVALGIFLLVIVMVWLFVKQSYSVQRFAFGQTTAISEAQRGVEILVKEAREALPGDNGAYALESADDFEFVLYTDYDRDLAVEKVRYFLDGSNFNKGVTEASGNPLEYLLENEVVNTISRYVRNEALEPVFTYYDRDYSGSAASMPMATPANVIDLKLVHIHLKINVYPEQAPKDFNLESDVQIRNLKDNL
jgi:prepilin-type N-terminal cleavage/methylation domain-containing protein